MGPQPLPALPGEGVWQGFIVAQGQPLNESRRSGPRPSFCGWSDRRDWCARGDDGSGGVSVWPKPGFSLGRTRWLTYQASEYSLDTTPEPR